jgi:hypothetical protein
MFCVSGSEVEAEAVTALLYGAWWAFSVALTAVQEARRSRAWAVGEAGSAA